MSVKCPTPNFKNLLKLPKILIKITYRNWGFQNVLSLNLAINYWYVLKLTFNKVNAYSVLISSLTLSSCSFRFFCYMNEIVVILVAAVAITLCKASNYKHKDINWTDLQRLRFYRVQCEWETGRQTVVEKQTRGYEF